MLYNKGGIIALVYSVLSVYAMLYSSFENQYII